MLVSEPLNQLDTPEKAASKSTLEPARSRLPSNSPQPGGRNAASSGAPSAGAGKGLGEHPRWRKPADVVVCRASEPPLPAKAPPRLLPQLPPAQASSRLLLTQPTHLAPCNKAAAMPSPCVPARRATGARTGEPPQPARRGAVRCATKSCGLGRPNCDGGADGSAGCWLLAAGELHAVVESSWLQVGAKMRLRVMGWGG
eukprot:scaffold143702_cov115-Phaeocystis_antarctica.AAC.2